MGGEQAPPPQGTDEIGGQERDPADQRDAEVEMLQALVDSARVHQAQEGQYQYGSGSQAGGDAQRHGAHPGGAAARCRRYVHRTAPLKRACAASWHGRQREIMFWARYEGSSPGCRRDVRDDVRPRRPADLARVPARAKAC